MNHRRSTCAGRICGHARRAVVSSAFERHVALFLVVLALLLAFFALALVHEILPGLCLEDTQDECPFCKLAHGLVLVLSALLFVFFTDPTRACHTPKAMRHAIPHAFYRLRAPPMATAS